VIIESVDSCQPPNTALVRTAQKQSVGVQGYLPPHNFTVGLLYIVAGAVQ
jgi:hypothetical protein